MAEAPGDVQVHGSVNGHGRGDRRLVNARMSRPLSTLPADPKRDAGRNLADQAAPDPRSTHHGHTMICILHGYLLEGSGSNLWTRAIVESLCRQGETVHLMAQENHPERYPFISEVRRYHMDGRVETVFRQASGMKGCCVLHKPDIGAVLPVYVWDRYDEFDEVVPMVELDDAAIERYVELNARALRRIVEENDVTAVHANHVVLMPVVAQRVKEQLGTPYSVMPHGSAMEYAVKRDPRLHALASAALAEAGHVFVHGEEMRGRVDAMFPNVPGLAAKFSALHLGVNTDQFRIVPRSDRRASIRQLQQALASLPRGNNPDACQTLLANIDASVGREEMQERFATLRDYDAKLPDAGLEAKLEGVDWENDEILLFVGRLISAKGIQDVIAALPLLLAARERLRLVVVGHGPLREPLEVLLRALQQGDRTLAETIIARGQALEGDPEGGATRDDLEKVTLFWERLRERGELDAYFETARRTLRPERVLFTGYLTHRELRHLFPCCDAAIFPSVVKEAGPLVFLEALASGVFPLGTYFGGIKASIDSVAGALPPEHLEQMKLGPEPAQTVADMVTRVPAALALSGQHREALRRVAVEHYDWQSVGRMFADALHALE